MNYIKATLKPGDMVLVRGQSRVSAAIQFKNLAHVCLGSSQENKLKQFFSTLIAESSKEITHPALHVKINLNSL